MTLVMLKPGDSGIIKGLDGKSGVVKRLGELGFVAGETVRVITELSGNVIVELKGSRLALNKAMANRVILTGQKEEEMKTLREIACGETVTVAKVHGEGALRRRILDMGLVKGTKIYVRKTAPLGDPMELTVRGYELSIRKDDAKMVEVK